MNKKAISFLLAAVLTLSLAACGGPAVSAPQVTNAPASEQPAAAEAPASAPVEAPQEEGDQNPPATEPEEEPAATDAPEEPGGPEEPSVETELVFGTATLDYAAYYAGDVSSTESYDAVSSATHQKYGIFSNIDTDFVDEETNADGYRILGVKNVAVAVPADQADAYRALNPSFEEGAAAEQYKPVTVEDGQAVYHSTVLAVAQTVDNARAELKTGSTWGDYEIDVYDNEGDNAANLLRRGRGDEDWPIGSDIQGIVLETADGFRVGMEYLQSIWVQPYEVSFNVTAESQSNAHIAVGGAWDNIPELAKLVGKTVTKITYLMPDSAYVYLFDGIYIKPAYPGDADIQAAPVEDTATITVEGIPEDLSNPTVTVVMGTGRGRSTLVNRETPVDGEVTMKDAEGNEAVYDPQQVYTVTVGSDNYADITASFPMGEGQRTQLEALAAQAAEVLEENEDEGLASHMAEAEALLSADAVTSAEATELINELNNHLAPYAPAEEAQGGGQGGRQGGGQGGGQGGRQG